MPNWTYTQLKVTGPIKDLKAFKEQAVDKKDTSRDLSFNSFVPMPESLDISKGSESDNAILLYGSKASASKGWERLLHFHNVHDSGVSTLEGLQLLFDLMHPEYRKLAATIESNIALYGHADWYDWSCEYWGTKWDACDVCLSVEDLDNDDESTTGTLEYSYNTAWSPSEPVIVAMSEQFPNLHFEATFDEESCEFYYTATFEQGEKVDEVQLERERDEEEDFDEEDDDACADLLESVSAQASQVTVQLTVIEQNKE